MKNKYAVILGNLGNTSDRFCKGYKDNPSTMEMLALAVKIPHVEGLELVGTWDILWIRRFEEIVDTRYMEIEALVQKNGAVATSRFLRSVFFK